MRVIGSSNSESAREEHKAGEHVLADLEFGSPEKTGPFFCWIFL